MTIFVGFREEKNRQPDEVESPLLPRGESSGNRVGYKYSKFYEQEQEEQQEEQQEQQQEQQEQQEQEQQEQKLLL